MIEMCPTCKGDLSITRVQCTDCDTVVESRYSACEFCRLTEASAEFLKVFIGARGNIKEVERALGIPYSQARARLDELRQEMGFDPEVERVLGSRPSSREVLGALAAGEITADQAGRYLKRRG